MTLYLSQKKLFLLLLLALAIGFSLSFVYDGLRLFRTLRQPKTRLFRFVNAVWISLEDFLFFTFAGAVMSILFYVTNSGKVRPSAFLMAILGFWLFRVTLSKLTYPLLLRLLFLIKLPLGWLLGFLKRVTNALALFIKRKSAKRFFRRVERLGQKGYRYGIRRL